MSVVLPKPPDLVDTLSMFESLTGAPRRELEWIAEAGELRAYPRGEIILRKAKKPARCSSS